MKVIELTDAHAAALKAKVAAEGLTLEAWLSKIASTETPAEHRTRAHAKCPTRNNGGDARRWRQSA